ncbi:hypothetical protein Q73_12955 [Bacillus coahuilensis m2-6]|uniref:glycosyltransferase family 4 protein n=1 Tax=Bacillus coahuilensis TaxID=408580 RepID=UPI0007504B7D|nr:MraY family glycosyltransferase [Bacillus coahuilensis]KUP05722.1 hypothetical protein Q73_12955 [Bacillus coahuilensis m2-6]
MNIDHIVGLIISIIVSWLITPLIRKFAFRYGFVDQPNYRKVHQNATPLLGGLSILIGATAGLVYIRPNLEIVIPVILGGAIIILTGFLDDKFNIAPWQKLIGQFLAASIVVFSGIKIDFITFHLFADERIHLGFIGYILALLWIIGITNAINLIDGLDGLAAGISLIALTSITILSIMNYQILVVSISVILIGGILGFLPYNFFPAKIFLGDTGSLFLGYCISVISIMGLYKSVTLFSLFLPIMVLAIPISDTLFAILRRLINKQKISEADKSHIHHKLLDFGFSQRKTVITIYLISAFFGLAAIVLSNSTIWFSTIVLIILAVFIQLIAEFIGLIGTFKPLTLFFQRRIPIKYLSKNK